MRYDTRSLFVQTSTVGVKTERVSFSDLQKGGAAGKQREKEQEKRLVGDLNETIYIRKQITERGTKLSQLKRGSTCVCSVGKCCTSSCCIPQIEDDLSRVCVYYDEK